MASKTRKKSAEAPAQPAATVPSIGETSMKLKETLEQLRAEAPEQAEQAAAQIAEALRPTPKSQIMRLKYEATYGQPLDQLRMRHALPRAGAVGRWLATHRGELAVDVREDVVFPVVIDGKPVALDQLVTLLNKRDEHELAEGLVADLKRYNEAKVARAVIFSFAAEHVEMLAEAEAAEPQDADDKAAADGESSEAEAAEPQDADEPSADDEPAAPPEWAEAGHPAPAAQE